MYRRLYYQGITVLGLECICRDPGFATSVDEVGCMKG